MFFSSFACAILKFSGILYPNVTDNKNEKKSARRFNLKKLWAGLKPKLAERAGLPVAILAVCLGVAVFISIGFMSGYSFNLMQVEEKLSPELKTKISELAKKASEQMAKREAEQKPPEPPPPAPATLSSGLCDNLPLSMTIPHNEQQ
jgi:hypothetical protein